jgi:hypothetical protein
MHLRHFLAASVASVSLACGIAAPAYAQETTSGIRGQVSSAGVPTAGATVEILDTNTGAKTTTATNSQGGFDISGLRSGDTYTVTVNAAGYQTATVTDVVTVVSQAYEVPIELVAESDGSSNVAIVVTATRLQGAGSVSQGPATVLGAAQIANVASVNRDIRDLSRRDPFARLDDTPSGGRAISFAGQNARYNRFTVDGVPITDSFGLNPDGLPSRRSPIPFDAIGQFQAKVAPFDIREGNFQGGSINVVLRSGSNKFQGTGFFAYSADELNGTKTKAGPGIPTGVVTLPNYTYKNFGVELSGPIIKDRLFFMIAGERLRAELPIAEGPSDNNAGTAISTINQSLVDQVSSIAKSKYNYDTGGVLKTNGDKDDRLVARLDANFSDTQRASLTYIYAKDQINLIQNTFATSPQGLGLASDAYIQGNKLNTGVFQLNSDWSEIFSTEFRAFYKDYVRIQDPLLGRGFAEFDVCTAPTSDRPASAIAGNTTSINCPTGFGTISFGPDISRQTNALHVKTYGGALQGRIKTDGHDIRLFGEFAATKTFNSFLQRSAGQYYFDSIADFQAGNAQRLRYQNDVLTLNPDDAAANFKYQSYTFGIGDTWRVSDMLTVNYGLRYDLYSGDSRPVFNQNFYNRYGFANTRYLNGLDLLQPRFGFTFKPVHEISLRGGIGLFGGGTPDVYVANSFSNTGVLTNSIDIQQTSNASYNNPSGSAILTNVNGATIPGAANTVLQSAALSGLAPTNALAPNFKLPSQWRGTLSLDWTPSGLLGGGWSFGADFLYSKVKNQVDFTDLRVAPNGLLTPDGRLRYTPITSFADTNSDLELTNSNLGRSYIEVVRVRKEFPWGLNLGVSYTHQNIKDKNPATSSVASSNYAAGVSYQANGPAYGISNDQVEHAIKWDITFKHAFFGDNNTIVSLFGESRSGHPYSYTFRDTATRSSVFGTIGSGSRYLLYVPTGINDPKVSYASATVASQIDAYISSTGLNNFRGRIAPRNGFTSSWLTKMDLHIEQELPGFLSQNAKFTVFADVENFTNLLNKNWGQIREFSFPYTATLVTVSCLTAPVANGASTTGLVAANAGQACAQYRYDANVKDSSGNFVAPTDTIYPRQSLYTIRIGARFKF